MHKLCTGVLHRGNRPEALKLCAIAHGNDQNMRKRRVSPTCSNRVLGSRTVEIGPEPENYVQKSTKTAKMCKKRRVLTMRSNRVPGVTYRGNRPGILKLCAIAHKNDKNMQKRRVLTIRFKSCTCGHEAVEISPEPHNRLTTRTAKLCENGEF